MPASSSVPTWTVPLSWNEIRNRAHEFSRRWAGEESERAEAQTFWGEFFNVFGVDRKRVAAFEQQVTLSRANEKIGHGRTFGRIDAFWKGVLLIEHKSAGQNLDRAFAQAQAETGHSEPTDAEIDAAAGRLMDDAAALFDEPRLRQTLVTIQSRNEQTIDIVSVDRVLEAGYDESATEAARQMVESFQRYIAEHRDEITALQILYSRPHSQRHLTYDDVRDLAARLANTPDHWTSEALWNAYARLEQDHVRGAKAQRLLTDIVSLVRHAVHPDETLAPYPELVQAAYERWLADQALGGRTFTPEQRWWLDRIAEYIGVNVAVTPDDLDVGEFYNRGGRIAARRVFGADLPRLLEELNLALAA